jgi:hypothetical protein
MVKEIANTTKPKSHRKSDPPHPTVEDVGPKRKRTRSSGPATTAPAIAPAVAPAIAPAMVVDTIALPKTGVAEVALPFKTPSPASAIGQKNNVTAGRDIISFRRKNMSFTEVDSTKSILDNIPLELIGRIFFSGYMTTVEVSSRLVPVCKDFYQVCKKTYRAADLRCYTGSALKLAKVIECSFKNLLFLDVSYCCVAKYFTALLSLELSDTLIGLSLRGCENMDDSSLTFVGQLTELKWLDISKTNASQKEDITDVGVMELLGLTNLELLNLACTNVTPESIICGLKEWTKLEHISFQCCMYMDSDDLFEAIGNVSLKSLDITGTLCEDSQFATLFTE